MESLARSWLKHEHAAAWMRDLLRGSAHGGDLCLLGSPKDIECHVLKTWRACDWIVPLEIAPTLTQRAINFNQCKNARTKTVAKYLAQFTPETTLSCHPDLAIWGPGPKAEEIRPLLPERVPFAPGEKVCYTGAHARRINAFTSWRGHVVSSKAFSGGYLVTVGVPCFSGDEEHSGCPYCDGTGIRESIKILDVHLCRPPL